MNKFYAYRHCVGFRETNLVGNVYFTNHLKWQGTCRELFLKDHCPEITQRLFDDLALETVACSCEYYAEAHVFDELEIRMTLNSYQQNRIKMSFAVQRLEPQPGLIARGEQTIACMQRTAEGTKPTPIPQALIKALETYK